MNEPATDSRGSSAISSLLITMVSLPLMMFLPLILAFAEHSLLGTDHIEELCHQLKIHDFLSMIYQPVMEGLKALFRFAP